jgi:hypothetical protein
MEQPDCRRIGKEPVSLQYYFYKIPVDWNGRYETPAGKAWPGRPRRRTPSRLPDRPRKASAWSGNHYTYPLSEIRSLSPDCLPSLLGRSACGVSASQLLGWNVANLFNPMRLTIKEHQWSSSLVFQIIVRDETIPNPLLSQTEGVSNPFFSCF